MTSLIPKAPADVELQISAAIAATDTSFTLTSATDDDGVALAAGLYCFTIDNGKSNKEYLIGTLSGTTVSSVSSVSRQGVSSSGAANAHRVGSPVIISNFASIQRVVDALNGSVDLDGSNVMSYDADPTFNQDQQIITKKYADDLSIAGAADATTTTKGIVEEATEAEIDADTAAGSTSARLFVNPSTLRTSEYGVQLPTADEKLALAGTGTPATGNKYVTEDYAVFAPPGMITPYGGSTAPTGWLLCDGTTGKNSVSDTTLADLYTAIGTTFGGTGAADFDLPDMRGNMPLGKDNMGGSSRNRVTDTEADTVGSEAGSQTHALTEAELAAHTHTTASFSTVDGSDDRFTTAIGDSTGSAGSSPPTSSTGSGTAHENMSPYMTLNYIIKT